MNFKISLGDRVIAMFEEEFDARDYFGTLCWKAEQQEGFQGKITLARITSEPIDNKIF